MSLDKQAAAVTSPPAIETSDTKAPVEVLPQPDAPLILRQMIATRAIGRTRLEPSASSNGANNNQKTRWYEWARTLGVHAHHKIAVIALQNHFMSIARSVAQELNSMRGSISERDILDSAEAALLFAIREFDPDQSPDFEQFARKTMRFCLRILINAVHARPTSTRWRPKNMLQNSTGAYRGVKNDPHFSEKHQAPDTALTQRIADWASVNHIIADTHEERMLAATIHFTPLICQQIDACNIDVHEERIRLLQSSTLQISSMLRSYDPALHGTDFCAYVQPAIVEHTQKKHAPFSGGPLGEKKTSTLQIPRNGRLADWARAQRIHVHGVVYIQGAIIKGHLHWMRGVCEVLHADTQATLPPDILYEAGYRLLKILANAFDPQESRVNFLTFAQPYLKPGILRCIAQGPEAIPDDLPPNLLPGFLADLLRKEGGEQINQDERRDPAVTTNVSTMPDKPSGSPPQTTTLTKQETGRKDAPTPAPSPEQTAEFLRQARVMEYVRAQVPGGKNAWVYEDAVTALSNEHLKLAKTMAHRELEKKVTGKIHNKAKDQAASKLLEEAIASFDPTDTEGQYFKGHLQSVIQAGILARYTSHT